MNNERVKLLKQRFSNLQQARLSLIPFDFYQIMIIQKDLRHYKNEKYAYKKIIITIILWFWFWKICIKYCNFMH